MTVILKVHTDRRTSVKRYFLDGKRISWRDASRLINEGNVTVIYR